MHYTWLWVYPISCFHTRQACLWHLSSPIPADHIILSKKNLTFNFFFFNFEIGSHCVAPCWLRTLHFCDVGFILARQALSLLSHTFSLCLLWLFAYGDLTFCWGWPGWWPSYFILLCLWDDGCTLPHPAFFPWGGVSWAFFFFFFALAGLETWFSQSQPTK
jgi:hypothetical protein